MTILINLINSALPAVFVFDGKRVFLGKKLGEKRKSGIVFFEMRRIFKLENLRLKDVKRLAALGGPSSWSALRGELAILNALGYASKLPCALAEEKDIVDLNSALKLIKKNCRRGIILPEYGGEPNITIRNN
jgi:hypothetical protein